jgi:hypothetical protein
MLLDEESRKVLHEIAFCEFISEFLKQDFSIEIVSDSKTKSLHFESFTFPASSIDMEKFLKKWKSVSREKYIRKSFDEIIKITGEKKSGSNNRKVYEIECKCKRPSKSK